MAETEVIITKRTACEALTPEKVTRDEFNAMTQDERDERAGEAAAWGVLCAGL